MGLLTHPNLSIDVYPPIPIHSSKTPNTSGLLCKSVTITTIYGIFGNRVQTVGVHMHRVEEKGCGFLSGQKSASDPDSLTQDRSPKQTINFLAGQSADWEDMKRGGQKVTYRPWAVSS